MPYPLKFCFGPCDALIGILVLYLPALKNNVNILSKNLRGKTWVRDSRCPPPTPPGPLSDAYVSGYEFTWIFLTSSWQVNQIFSKRWKKMYLLLCWSVCPEPLLWAVVFVAVPVILGLHLLGGSGREKFGLFLFPWSQVLLSQTTRIILDIASDWTFSNEKISL